MTSIVPRARCRAGPGRVRHRHPRPVRQAAGCTRGRGRRGDARAGAGVTNEEAHRIAREEGVSRSLYALVRGIFVPFMRLWWGLRIIRRRADPGRGARDRDAEPQELLGQLLPGGRDQAAPALHGQVGAVRGPARQDVRPPRSVPGAPRRVRRRGARDRTGDPRAGRAPVAVPGGHARARPGGAWRPEARRRAARARDRRAPGARGDHRHGEAVLPARFPGRRRSGCRSATRSRSTSSRRRPRPRRRCSPRSSGPRSRASSDGCGRIPA